MHNVQSYNYDRIKNTLTVTLDSYANYAWMMTQKNLNVTTAFGQSPSDIESIEISGLGTKTFWITLSTVFEKSVFRDIVQWVNLTNIIIFALQ